MAHLEEVSPRVLGRLLEGCRGGGGVSVPRQGRSDKCSRLQLPPCCQATRLCWPSLALARATLEVVHSVDKCGGRSCCAWHVAVRLGTFWPSARSCRLSSPRSADSSHTHIALSPLCFRHQLRINLLHPRRHACTDLAIRPWPIRLTLCPCSNMQLLKSTNRLVVWARCGAGEGACGGGVGRGCAAEAPAVVRAVPDKQQMDTRHIDIHSTHNGHAAQEFTCGNGSAACCAQRTHSESRGAHVVAGCTSSQAGGAG